MILKFYKKITTTNLQYCQDFSFFLLDWSSDESKLWQKKQMMRNQAQGIKVQFIFSHLDESKSFDLIILCWPYQTNEADVFWEEIKA